MVWLLKPERSPNFSYLLQRERENSMPVTLYKICLTANPLRVQFDTLFLCNFFIFKRKMQNWKSTGGKSSSSHVIVYLLGNDMSCTKGWKREAPSSPVPKTHM